MCQYVSNALCLKSRHLFVYVCETGYLPKLKKFRGRTGVLVLTVDSTLVT